jgi:O-antigen/teichoic acid export membrane protein
LSFLESSYQNKSSLKKRLLSGGAWAFGGKVVTSICGLLLNAFLTRLLTPEEVGTYFLSYSVASFGAIIAQFGMRQTIVRLVAEALSTANQQAVKSSIKTVAIIIICNCALVASFYYLFAEQWISQHFFESNKMSSVSGLISMWLIILALQAIIAEIFRGFHDIRFATIFGGLITSLLSASLFIVTWFIAGGSDLEHILILSLSSGLTSVCFGSILLSMKVVPLKGEAKFKPRRTVAIAAPLFVSTMAFFAISEAHIWILGVYCSDADVAIYGAVFRLVSLVTMPLLLVNSVVPPMIADLYTRKEFIKVEDVLRKSASVAGVPAIAILIMIIGTGEFLLKFIFGEYYVLGFKALSILAVGNIINVVTGSPGVLLTMAGKQNVLMCISIISGLSGLGATLLFIGEFKYNGVATGVCLGVIIHNLSMWYYSKKNLYIDTHIDPRFFSEILFQIRRKISRSRQKNIFWYTFEILIRLLENLYWFVRGYYIIECFGDSHAKIFEKLNKCINRKQITFRVTSVDGATAFGMANPNSKTNALQVFTEWIKRTPQNYTILIMLGEVDTGFLIWLKAQKENKKTELLLQDALDRYQSFICKVKINHPKIIICSAPLPTIKDGQNLGRVAKMRQEVKVSQIDRTKMTLKFNESMRLWARTNDVLYLNLDTYAYNKNTGIAHDFLLNKDPNDHHYDEDAFIQMLKKAFVTKLDHPNRNI